MNELETAVVNEPSVFEPLKFYCTLERNKNATLFQWKIHGLLFKLLEGENEPSCFQETLTNSTNHCLEILSIKNNASL